MKCTILLLVVVLAVATVSAQRSSRGRVVFRSSSSSRRPSSSRSFRPSSRVTVTRSRPTSSSRQIISAPAPAPNPAQTLSFHEPVVPSSVSFNAPLSLGGGLAGFGTPVRHNPRSSCPSCTGPGLDSFFAEPVNPITLNCLNNLARRIPGSRVHVGLEEVFIIDANGFPREEVFDGFGRNLFENCEI